MNQAARQQPHARDASGPPADPSGRQWPLLVVALLLLNIVICAVTVTLSLRNPADIEPDYYDKALNWDSHRGLDAAGTPGQTE